VSVTADASAPPANPAMGALTMSGDDVHGRELLSVDMMKDEAMLTVRMREVECHSVRC